MEQYLNLIWKNYTASLSENSDDNAFDENDDSTDLFVNNNLHYNVPFWVGVVVITVLVLCAVIATIRYCIYTFCSSSIDAEKLVLTPPRSPNFSSSVVNTDQRRRRQVPDTISQHLSDETELSSSSPEQWRDQRSDISIIPIIRQQYPSTRHHQTEIDIDNINRNYFSSNYNESSRTPRSFRKKVHDIYVLPVSPSLSSLSSSTTTNTDDMVRIGSSTMPIRSRRYLQPNQNDSPHCGVKNACFTDSPQLKNRTLPRSHNGTLRRIPAPSQPPPLPPAVSLQFSNTQSSSIVLNPDTIGFRFDNHEEKPVTKTAPPPVPSRSQKPTILPIGFEEIIKQSESSPQDDHSEHTWPNPPESMTTSQISGPLSIPYDHLIPTIIMHQYRPNEHSILTQSDP
ncbi:hypothetical protein I4U23_026375 [Adineta vaga]|nr:hypothetical protein I4U23_026375 [Adineta vaga]